MITPAPADKDAVRKFRQTCHPCCVVCSPFASHGLGLSFSQEADGSVVGEFSCHKALQGYPDRLHGGVVATLLDASMTHSLFARGIEGVTVRLNIKYSKPVELGLKAVIRARVTSEYPPLYVLKAQVIQNDEVRASAEAKFYVETAKAKRPMRPVRRDAARTTRQTEG